MSDVHSVYPVSIRWERDRLGLGSSVDGLPDLPVSAPPAFGGPGGIWSPEHLFVLSAASCWMTTFIAIAAASKLDYGAIECGATGTLEKGDDRRFWVSKILLRPRVTIASEEARERTQRVIEKSEWACLISNSMRSAVTVEAVIDLTDAVPVSAS